MPTHCEKCFSCLEKSCALRYNKATKNKGGYEMEDNGIVKEDNVGPIQRYYYEDMMCRRDEEVEEWHKAWKTTFIALIVAVCIIIGGLVGFIYYEKQFEVVENTVTQDIDTGDGDLAVTGIGDLYYGDSSADSQNPKTNP
jgi:hypothetical protein